MVRKVTLLVAVVSVLLIGQSMRAEDAATTPSVAGAPAASSMSATGAQAAAKNKTDDKAGIDQWIAALGSANYNVREEAVEKLIAAGSPAIGPLVKATRSEDLETSYRAVRALQSLLDKGDEAAQQAADELQKLAADPSAPVSDLAADALSLYHLTLQDKAVAALRKLGATVASDLPLMGPGDVQITLDKNWKGKTSDLNLLKEVRNLAWLRVINRPLDEKELATIGDLTQTLEVDLLGTDVSAEAAQKLAASLPDAVIDRRNGAFLGVGGAPGMNTCTITEVREETAAAAAGILPGDEITSFDGQPVHNFEEFTTLVSNKKGGDQIELQLRRQNDELTKKVTLGQWQADQPVMFHGNASRGRAMQLPAAPLPTMPLPAAPIQMSPLPLTPHPTTVPTPPQPANGQVPEPKHLAPGHETQP